LEHENEIPEDIKKNLVLLITFDKNDCLEKIEKKNSLKNINKYEIIEDKLYIFGEFEKDYIKDESIENLISEFQKNNYEILNLLNEYSNIVNKTKKELFFENKLQNLKLKTKEQIFITPKTSPNKTFKIQGSEGKHTYTPLINDEKKKYVGLIKKNLEDYYKNE
jgi:hypothetical protein